MNSMIKVPLKKVDAEESTVEAVVTQPAPAEWPEDPPMEILDPALK